MSNEFKVNVDLGLTPVFQAAAKFFEALCLPVAEELGQIFKYEVQQWRKDNLARIGAKAQARIGSTEGKQVHPRILHEVVDHGSWVDDDYLQECWAGLLVSSWNETGDDDSNLIFTRLLEQMSGSQARILHYLCELTPPQLNETGLVYPAHATMIDVDKLLKIARITDRHRLDRELDNLNSLGVTHGGVQFQSPGWAELSASTIGYHLFSRCQGSRLSIDEFYRTRLKQKSSSDLTSDESS